MSPLDPQYIRRLVEEEIERQLRSRTPPSFQKEPTDPSTIHRNVLVVLTGCDVELDRVMAQLRLLAERNRVTVVPTKGFLSFVSRSELEENVPGCSIVEEIPAREIRSFVSRYKLVIVPLLSMNTLAGVALGIADSLAPIVLIQALLQDKPMLALRETVAEMTSGDGNASQDSADVPAWSGLQTAHAALEVGVPHRHPATHISGLYKGYLRTLEQWGVRFVELKKLGDESEAILNPDSPPPTPVSSSEQPRQKRQIITRDDLWELKRTGVSEIRVAPNAIITDVARDFARDNGMNIMVEET